jgi:hypothetical protein
MNQLRIPKIGEIYNDRYGTYKIVKIEVKPNKIIRKDLFLKIFCVKLINGKDNVNSNKNLIVDRCPFDTLEEFYINYTLDPEYVYRKKLEIICGS